MDVTDVLVKEQDVARELYREQRAIQETYTKVFAAAIVALITFIIKGDLPQSAYLLVAAVQLLGTIYILYIAYRKRICAGVYVLAERRLGKHLREKHPGTILFVLEPMRRYLRDGYPHRKKGSKSVNFILIFTYAVTYVVFVELGLRGLSLTAFQNRCLLACWVLGLLLFAQMSLRQNGEQKSRYKELTARMDLGPDFWERVEPSNNTPDGICQPADGLPKPSA
jgi:hypothetical protein